jgi:hypothetical protein
MNALTHPTPWNAGANKVRAQRSSGSAASLATAAPTSTPGWSANDAARVGEDKPAEWPLQILDPERDAYQLQAGGRRTRLGTCPAG